MPPIAACSAAWSGAMGPDVESRGRSIGLRSDSEPGNRPFASPEADEEAEPSKSVDADDIDGRTGVVWLPDGSTKSFFARPSPAIEAPGRDLLCARLTSAI